MAGDMRVNEHPFIGTLHIVFLREHNRIAKLLREYLPEHLRTVIIKIIIIINNDNEKNDSDDNDNNTN